MGQHRAGSVKATSRISEAPPATFSGFHGPGLSFESLPASTERKADESAQVIGELQQQLQYHQQLLLIWQQQPCTLCQLRNSSSSSSSTSGRSGQNTGAADAGKKNPASTVGEAPAASSAGGLQEWRSPIDKALRQQQVLIAQLQRQVMVLQVELSSREQLVLEADAVLAEAGRKLGSLAALTTAAQGSISSTSSSSFSSARHGIRSAVRAVRTQSAVCGAGGAAVTPSGSGGGGSAPAAQPPAASVVAVADQVLEQVQDVAAWCKAAAARIGRCRAESAAQCRAARGTCRASSSGGSSSWDGEAGDEVMRSLRQLQLQYIPAGGNLYMQPSASLTLPAIAQGQGLPMLHLPALHSLMQQLTSLAQPLADLAVQLRTVVLPVLPWLAAGSVGQQLPGSCAAVAQAAAAAAAELIELCSVLPAVPGCLSAPAVAAARRSRIAAMAAVEQAGAWGSGSSDDYGAATADRLARLSVKSSQQQQGHHHHEQQHEQQQQEQQQQQQSTGQGLDAADLQLFDDLDEVLQAMAAHKQSARASSSTSGAGSSSRHLTAAVSPQGNHSSSCSSSSKQQAQGAHALLRQLLQRWRVLWFKRQTLERQLGFVARCSAEQAKLVSGLVQQVAAAVTAAADAHDEAHGLRERHAAAVKLVGQLQRAALLWQQQQQQQRGVAGEAVGAAALRGLAGLLEQHWNVLGDLPEVLQAGSAAAVKAAALAAVAEAYEAFRTELQDAQKTLRCPAVQ